MNAMIAPNIPTKPSADRLLLRMEKRDLAGEYSVHFWMTLLVDDCTALCYRPPSHDSRDDYSRVAPNRVERTTTAAAAIGAMANGAGES